MMGKNRNMFLKHELSQNCGVEDSVVVENEHTLVYTSFLKHLKGAGFLVAMN